MSDEKIKKQDGLWIKKDKNGNDYLSGSLDDNNFISIFKNKYKEPGDKKPDFKFIITPKKSAENQVSDPDSFQNFK